MKRILISTAALAAVVALSGCTANSASVESADSAPTGEQFSGTGFAAPEDGAALSEGARAEQAADREVVTTGTMSVTAEDPIAAAAEAAAIVEESGGRVDSRRESAPSEFDQGSASLTVRIRADELTATLEELKGLGESQSVSLDRRDVTTEAQDLDARIGALRASVDRLTALLSTAADTEVLIRLESAISERQGTLESMEAQRRSLSDQVSLSTIDLSLLSAQNAPVAAPDTFWSGLAAGWSSFTGFVGFVLVAAGVLLPWAVVAGVLALVALLVVKRMRHGRPEAVIVDGA